MKTSSKSQLIGLSDEELRVKVAELCGWAIKDGCLCHNGSKVIPAYGWNMTVLSHANVPNYPCDLNVMHEAEKMLSPDDWPKYLRELAERNESEHRFEVENRFAVVSATARQRAEAFVKTLTDGGTGERSSSGIAETPRELKSSLQVAAEEHGDTPTPWPSSPAAQQQEW